MKTNLELIEGLPGIKFARHYSPKHDTHGEIFVVQFEPHASKKVLFTNSLDQDLFRDGKVWYFRKKLFTIESGNINNIPEAFYSECDSTSEIYSTEADAYRQMVMFAAEQGKPIEKISYLGWSLIIGPPRFEEWHTDVDHPENVYRIAEEPKAKAKPLFTNSLGQEFFENQKVWRYDEKLFITDSASINKIEEDNYSACDSTSEIYPTEAAAYRHMIMYAAQQGTRIEYNSGLEWMTVSRTKFIHPLRWHELWQQEPGPPENAYRIAKEVKEIKYEPYTMEDEVEWLLGKIARAKTGCQKSMIIGMIDDMQLEFLFRTFTIDGEVIGKPKKEKTK